MMPPPLPAPYADARWTSGLTYNRRHLTATITGPGELHRNTYEMAWFEIIEAEPWRGESRHISCLRRRGTTYAREGFTPAAQKAIQATLLPIVHRYGFDRWWNELHRTRGDIAVCEQRASYAQRVAEWWRLRGDLVAMHAAGDLELRGHPEGHYGPATVLSTDQYGRVERTEVVASAWCHGEQVGWLTRNAELVPLDALLDDRGA